MKKLVMALAVVTMPGAASASTIYDEDVLGDLPTYPPSYSLGTVSGGLILGSLDAGTDSTDDGPDENDRFSFTLTETLDFSISIENEVAENSGYLMYDETDDTLAFTDSNVPSSLSAGSYNYNFVPNTNEGSFDYTIQFGSDFAAVPVPAGAALYLPLLIGAGAWAARRRTRFLTS